MKIAIIEYGSGNIFSVSSALKRLGADVIVTNETKIIESADAVIFPGVGHAKFAMEELKNKGLDRFIPTLKQPVLGICLGMQLMCDYTEEGDVTCLGIFDNVKVKKFVDSPKIPHMGWNKIFNNKDFFEGCDSEVYFVHSYYAEKSKYTVSEVNYGSDFSAALQKDNFFACQFHPEKSGKSGEQLLNNFIKKIKK